MMARTYKTLVGPRSIEQVCRSWSKQSFSRQDYEGTGWTVGTVPWTRSVDLSPYTYSQNQTTKQQDGQKVGPWQQNRSIDLGPQTHSLNQTTNEQDRPWIGPQYVDLVHQLLSTYNVQNLRTVDRTIFHGPGQSIFVIK